MLTFGSSFAGIGNFDSGFESAGMTCLWQVEIEPDCRSVLARHFPTALCCEDVRYAGSEKTLLQRAARYRRDAQPNPMPAHEALAYARKHTLPYVDIICGGFPCQDLSIAGKRAGLEGARSGLFYELVRITDELKPMFLVWENVPGLISSDNGRDFARVLRALDDIGYSGAWTGLDAQWFGVAQRRRRIFGVFARRSVGAARCAEILSLSSGLRRDTPTRKEAGTSVARTITGGTRSGSSHGKQSGSDRAELVAHTLKAEGADASEDGTGRGTPLVITPFDTTQITSAGNYSQPKPGEPCHPLAAGAHAPAIAFDWQSGGEVRLNISGEHTSALQANQMPAVAFQCQGTNVGEMGTLRKGNGHTTGGVPFVNQMGVRRLTPRECERLQGCTDDWTLYGADGEIISDSARYRMLGNAVADPCAKWIGKRIIEVMTPNL